MLEKYEVEDRLVKGITGEISSSIYILEEFGLKIGFRQGWPISSYNNNVNYLSSAGWTSKSACVTRRAPPPASGLVSASGPRSPHGWSPRPLGACSACSWENSSGTAGCRPRAPRDCCWLPTRLKVNPLYGVIFFLMLIILLSPSTFSHGPICVGDPLLPANRHSSPGWLQWAPSIADPACSCTIFEVGFPYFLIFSL